MKLTKARLIKVFLKEKQTRKKYINKKILTHTNTYRNKKPFNLKNTTLKNHNF